LQRAVAGEWRLRLRRIGANARIGWWFMKNAFGRLAASANASSNCARYLMCMGTSAGSGATGASENRYDELGVGVAARA
jgi:hypothetical protein